MISHLSVDLAHVYLGNAVVLDDFPQHATVASALMRGSTAVRLIRTVHNVMEEVTYQ